MENVHELGMHSWCTLHSIITRKIEASQPPIHLDSFLTLVSVSGHSWIDRLLLGIFEKCLCPRRPSKAAILPLCHSLRGL